MFHASKTKHENFSESSEAIKPLTAEEKAAKVLEIREKIKVHQAKKAKLEAEENREKEKKRREDGKAMISHKEAARDREIRLENCFPLNLNNNIPNLQRSRSRSSPRKERRRNRQKTSSRANPA